MIKILLIALMFNFLPAKSEAFTKEEEAFTLYLKAVSSNAKAEDVQNAIIKYNNLIEVEPILEYKIKIASLTAVQARFAIMPNKKLEMVNKSVDSFEEIELNIKHSNNQNLICEFYLYRGRTFIEFPSFLKKRTIAINDLKTASEVCQHLNRASEEKGGLFLTYAKALKKQGNTSEARVFASKALKEELSKEDAKQAKKLLN